MDGYYRGDEMGRDVKIRDFFDNGMRSQECKPTGKSYTTSPRNMCGEKIGSCSNYTCMHLNKPDPLVGIDNHSASTPQQILTYKFSWIHVTAVQIKKR